MHTGELEDSLSRLSNLVGWIAEAVETRLRRIEKGLKLPPPTRSIHDEAQHNAQKERAKRAERQGDGWGGLHPGSH